MKVAFLTHFYAPERGAPQTRLRETIAGMRRQGDELTVVTGPPHYPAGRILDGQPAWRWRTETIDGTTVHRLPMIPRPNAGIADRIVDQGSFAAVAILAAPIIRGCDAFVVESPPLFLAGTAALLRTLTGRPYLLHVADPWPDFPIAAGVLHGRLPIALALRLEELAYRGARLITTVTPPLVERLGSKPGAAGKVRLLLNAVDTARFQPDVASPAARAELGWEEAPTLVYSGTVGLAQGLATLLGAARLVRDLDLRIKVVGSGVEAAQLERQARSEGLTKVNFLPAMTASAVPTLLAAADGILVLLRRGPLYEESLPTKLVEGFAAGRPIVLSADGYAAQLVREAEAGFVAPAESAARLADAIRRFGAASAASRARHAAAGRQLAIARFERGQAVATLRDYLAQVVDPARRPLGATARRGEH